MRAYGECYLLANKKSRTITNVERNRTTIDEYKNDVAELVDPKLISNLAFFTDLTDHMNLLNLILQGPEQFITDIDMIVV